LAKQKVAETQNLDVQFHQQLKLQISSVNWCTFCHALIVVCPIGTPKKASHPIRAKKSRLFMLVKLTQAVNFINQKSQRQT